MTAQTELARGMAQQNALSAMRNGLQYGQAGIRLERSAGVTDAFFNGQHILQIEGRFSRETFGLALKAHVDKHHVQVMSIIDTDLHSQLEIPEEHSYRKEIDSTSKFGLLITNNRSSWINKVGASCDDKDQLDVEFRVFMDEPRALVFMSYGPRWAFQGKGLLEGRSQWVKADNYFDLAIKIKDVYLRGLAAIPAARLALSADTDKASATSAAA